jgi:hypothetical protein
MLLRSVFGLGTLVIVALAVLSDAPDGFPHLDQRPQGSRMQDGPRSVSRIIAIEGGHVPT